MLSFRYANETDCALILQFIRELAQHEQMLDQVTATEELLHTWLFEKQRAEVLFAMEDGREVASALFFHNFSTFQGRAGIYLEDLYVRPESRGCGYGKAVLRKLAQIALERGCGRLEWVCHNALRSSIDFYLALGAKPMDEWTIYRLQDATLSALAADEQTDITAPDMV